MSTGLWQSNYVVDLKLKQKIAQPLSFVERLRILLYALVSVISTNYFYETENQILRTLSAVDNTESPKCTKYVSTVTAQTKH